MLFSAPCKTGQLQVDETMVRVVAPFNKVAWSIPRATITRITHAAGSMATLDLTIHSTQGMFSAPFVTKRNTEKFLALFPATPIQQIAAQPRGNAWYHDPNRLTYVGTYTDEKPMQKEVEAAAQCGWMPQGSTGTGGHINVGRTAAKVALLGPISLITGASRSKDKVTITFVRTPEWLAEQRQNQPR
jgi:hypothetical protein